MPSYNPQLHGHYDAYLAKFGKKKTMQSNNPTNPLDAMSAEEQKQFLLEAQAARAAIQSKKRDYSVGARADNQMNSFFNYDTWAGQNDGRSQKEERRNKKLTKSEIDGYKVAKKERKERKERQWLRD